MSCISLSLLWVQVKGENTASVAEAFIEANEVVADDIEKEDH